MMVGSDGSWHDVMICIAQLRSVSIAISEISGSPQEPVVVHVQGVEKDPVNGCVCHAGIVSQCHST